jgi:hypothetical protein
MVEFALVLPVFIFLIMGALQMALLCLVWIGLQGVVQDTARWMSISSQAPTPISGNCNPTGTNPLYPRPRWANGNDGVTYRDCNLPPPLVAANFTAWNWTPACTSGSDCLASGVRRVDSSLTLTATYNWSNIIVLPMLGGTVGGWTIPTTVTVTATEVMQY